MPKKRPNTEQDYSPDELATLHRIYPHEGMDGCMQALPHRTRFSIRTKVNELGIKLTPEAFSRKRREAALRAKVKRETPRPDGETILGTPPFLFAPSVFALGAALDGQVKPHQLSGPPGRVHQSDDEPLVLEF